MAAQRQARVATVVAPAAAAAVAPPVSALPPTPNPIRVVDSGGNWLLAALPPWLPQAPPASDVQRRAIVVVLPQAPEPAMAIAPATAMATTRRLAIGNTTLEGTTTEGTTARGVYSR